MLEPIDDSKHYTKMRQMETDDDSTCCEHTAVK